jgi:hypothetical protein
MNSELTARYDALYEKLVPISGKCATVEGEVLRAASRLGYRWYNDGDKFFEDYGCETAGAAATYLRNSQVPELKKLIDSISKKFIPRNKEGDKKYGAFIDKVMAAVVEWVESKDGKYSNNDKDYLATRSLWVWRREEDYD